MACYMSYYTGNGFKASVHAENIGAAFEDVATTPAMTHARALQLGRLILFSYELDLRLGRRVFHVALPCAHAVTAHATMTRTASRTTALVAVRVSPGEGDANTTIHFFPTGGFEQQAGVVRGELRWASPQR
jgi:hypothetical protein